MLTTFFEQWQAYKMTLTDGRVLECALVLDIRDTDFLITNVLRDAITVMDKPVILMRSSIFSAEKVDFVLSDSQGKVIHEWLATW